MRLHCEIASSGTRCLCCKPVLLVTLGGCHLLDGLVARGSFEARKEGCAVLRRRDYEGFVLTPQEITKGNSSGVWLMDPHLVSVSCELPLWNLAPAICLRNIKWVNRHNEE